MINLEWGHFQTHPFPFFGKSAPQKFQELRNPLSICFKNEARQPPPLIAHGPCQFTVSPRQMWLAALHF